MTKNKTWLVTGASKGLGLALVEKLIKEGYNVAATSRDISSFNENLLSAESFLPVSMDLGSDESVKNAITTTINHFGSIDALVNNAGYGLTGAVEELGEQEVFQNFNVNVFGVYRVLKYALPFLRAQKSGHIFNIGSVVSTVGDFPGWSSYVATKFAVNGLTESLAIETEEFGIKTTIICPGYFRTNFLTSDSWVTANESIGTYTSVAESKAVHANDIDQNQPGDPQKAARVIIDLYNSDECPLHLYLGSDAYNLASKKFKTLQDELEKWKTTTLSTDFD